MKRGFTLIELILVLGVISVLAVVLIMTLNPVQQLNKAQNALRQQSVESIKPILEQYYSDQSCYPQTLPFGNNLTYKTKVYGAIPEDPLCSSGWWCYSYQTDGSVCPQWYVLYYAQQGSFSQSSVLCPLVAQSNCLPPNFSSSAYNSCMSSDDYNCSYISTHAMTLRK